MIAEDALVAVAEQALDGMPSRVRAVIGEAPGWEPFEDWMRHPDAAPPAVELRRERPARAALHERHRVAAQGHDPHQPLP